MLISVMMLTVLFASPDSSSVNYKGVGAATTYIYPNRQTCEAAAQTWATRYKVVSTVCSVSYIPKGSP